MDTSQLEEVSVTLPSYEEVQDALGRAKSSFNAAEAHGMLCGFICAGNKMDGVAWVEPVLGHVAPGDVVAQASRTLLIKVYECSFRQLSAMAFDFSLVLPTDEHALNQRALALGEWCQGFMAGLGLAGLAVGSAYSEDARDALYHFSEIAKIDYENIEITEEDEKSYAEVVEYVRMAVLMIYTEFGEQQGSQTPGDGGNKALH